MEFWGVVRKYVIWLLLLPPDCEGEDFFFFFNLAALSDISSSTRDQSPVPAVKAPSPNHWNFREFLRVKTLENELSNGH